MPRVRPKRLSSPILAINFLLIINYSKLSYCQNDIVTLKNNLSNDSSKFESYKLPVEDNLVTTINAPTNRDQLNLALNTTKSILTPESRPHKITSSPKINVTDSTYQDDKQNCSKFNSRKLEIQPIQTPESRLKKCCPMGESLYDVKGSKVKICDTEHYSFDVELISAVIFDNCIEDLEENIELEVEAGNPCNASYVYSKASGDQIFALQDGSLLLMDEFGNDSYEIVHDYCLDVDYKTNDLKAIVCISSIDSHISPNQAILFASFMAISIPCLLVVAYLHFKIRELRTVHGLSLGVLSMCLAIGFLLHIYAQVKLKHNSKSKIGYAVQFFMLSYFSWMVMLCLNVCVTVWYFLPRFVTISRLIRYGRLASYALIAFTIPFILVMITYSKRLPGMPSYFYQGWSESVQESQRYFITPVSFFIGTSFILLIISYFGFRKLDGIVDTGKQEQYQAIMENRLEDANNISSIDREFFLETKKDAQCIVILGLIISITWILEVITFYSPGESDYLAFMEIMNGLQGLFILMIFVVGRDRRNIICRWWHDRGSHEVTPVIVPRRMSSIPPGSTVEMTNLNNNS